MISQTVFLTGEKEKKDIDVQDDPKVSLLNKMSHGECCFGFSGRKTFC